MSSKLNKVVVASDSFKECLTSLQVADGVEAGIRSVIPGCQVVKVAVADGGEGTVDAILQTLGGQRVAVMVEDPVGRQIKVEYALLDDGLTAAMEMASASGLALLSPEERNPMKTSTYGFGQMISDALSRGCRRFLIGIGGSATNDGGVGMLTALGWRFYDSDDVPLSGYGEDLKRISRIDDSNVCPHISDSEFIIACDVESPLFGPSGAAYVYGPQKGADPNMVEELDSGLKNLADVMNRDLGYDVSDMPGAGAAGGLGGAFLAFMGAVLRKGAEMVLDAVGFDDIIGDADLVVTGEGRLDMQTLNGKLPYAVARRASLRGIPVLAVCGKADVDELPGFMKIIQVTPDSMPLSEAMRPATAYSNIAIAIASQIEAQEHF